MIALQYRFPLADDFDMTRIRQRVAEKGHLFDDYPGLVQKAFLMRESDGGDAPAEAAPLDSGPGDSGKEYATFYLWRAPEDARNFLLSDAFKAVSDAFGRPDVRSYLILDSHPAATAAPPAFAVQEWSPLSRGTTLADTASREIAASKRIAARPGCHSHIVALDPTTWEVVRFGLWHAQADCQAMDADNSRLYQVLHFSTPGAQRDSENAA